MNASPSKAPSSKAPSSKAPSPKATGPRGPGSASPARSLLDRLAGLRQTVTALVEHRSAGDPTANDPLRGLYLSEEAVSHLLRTWPDAGPDAGVLPDLPAGRPEDADDRLARTTAPSSRSTATSTTT
jgi:hypothetical protein